jgi:hypothetical protein
LRKAQVKLPACHGAPGKEPYYGAFQLTNVAGYVSGDIGENIE